MSAINAVKKWSKDSAKSGKSDTNINVIWFCVDGTSRKLFPETIKSLSKATSMWESIPLIVVITKSYSIKEREENIQMVNNAFANQKKYSNNLKKIIPVVASTYELNDTAFAPPEGITELIDITNELMPEGIKGAEQDINKFVLNRKRALAQSCVGVATATGVTIGAVPIPFADAALLSPLEVVEINSLSKIYGIKNDNKSKQFINSIIEVGTVSVAAKAAISALKVIPGINIGASVLNAIIAGGIVASIGEGCIYAFEKIYLGEKSLEDIDWVTKLMESKLSNQFIEKVTDVIKKVAESDKKDVSKLIIELLSVAFKSLQ